MKEKCSLLRKYNKPIFCLRPLAASRPVCGDRRLKVVKAGDVLGDAVCVLGRYALPIFVSMTRGLA
jgi:hypothetical protein